MWTWILVNEEALTNCGLLYQIIKIVIIMIILILNLLKYLAVTVHNTRICINLCDMCTNIHNNLYKLVTSVQNFHHNLYKLMLHLYKLSPQFVYIFVTSAQTFTTICTNLCVICTHFTTNGINIREIFTNFHHNLYKHMWHL